MGVGHALKRCATEVDEIARPPLEFDPQTALAYHFVQAMVNASLLLLSWSQDRKNSALGWWSASHAVAPVAFLAMGMSVAFASPWLFGLGQVVLILHWTFMLVALRVNDRRRWLLAVTPPLLIAAAVVLGAADQLTIIVAFKCVSVVLALAIGRELWLARGDAPTLRLLLIALVVGHTLVVTIYIWSEAAHAILLETTAYGSANALLFIALSKAGVEAALRTAATTDSLTRLANRGAFRARAQSILDLARQAGRPVALVMFDLDRFKSINDRFGHPAGDHILCVFAEIVGDRFRKNDAIGRLGGEEFGAVLANVTVDQVVEIVERIRSAFATSNVVMDGYSVETTVSAGIVLDRKAGRELDSLFASADELLYRAKTGGRNRLELRVLPEHGEARTEAAIGVAPRAATLAPAQA
jgi:diguanylate cyclase (GGDEF)-like protein